MALKRLGSLGVWMGALAAGAAAWLLLAQARPVAAGIRQSLAVCGNLLIPSLFPFMVLATLLPNTRAGWALAAPARWLGRLYGAPPALAPALLMSWIGGYPAGARALAQLVDSRQITPRQASRALCYCVHGGPAFVVTVVGAGVFGSVRAGLLLWGCQLAAGILVARLLGRMPRDSAGGSPPPLVFPSFATALVSSVSSAAAGMVTICAFVLLMGGGAAMLEATGALGRLAGGLSALTGGWLTPAAARVLLSGGLEVTVGCAAATGLAPLEALTVLPFLLSFGGVSVVCQLAASVEGRRLTLGRLLPARLLHGLLTQLLAWPLLAPLCRALPAFASGAPALQADAKTPLATLLLLGAVAVFCLTLEEGPVQNR